MNRSIFHLALLICWLMLATIPVHAQQRQSDLNRQLIAALVKNDVKQALALVNAGADPNTRYELLLTPTFQQLQDFLWLHVPMPMNNSPTAFMIACGVYWYVDKTDFSPRYSSIPASPLLIEAMVKHGANVNTKTIDGWTPLMAMSKDAAIVRLFLEHGANPSAQDRYGRTALLCALRNFNNYSETVRLLLEHGADPNAKLYGSGLTMLIEAVRCEEPDTVRMLLEHGADVNAQTKSDETALVRTIFYLVRHPDTAGELNDVLGQLLAHGANPNLPDNVGDTALKLAQDANRPDLVALLQHSGK